MDKPAPKNVLKLIAKHTKQKPAPAPAVIPAATLWSRISRRKPKSS